MLRGTAVLKKKAQPPFSEQELAGITLMIGMTNFWNRINLTTWQISGEWVETAVEQVERQLHAAAD